MNLIMYIPKHELLFGVGHCLYYGQ